jgi:hypothetical protein
VSCGKFADHTTDYDAHPSSEFRKMLESIARWGHNVLLLSMGIMTYAILFAVR